MSEIIGGGLGLELQCNECSSKVVLVLPTIRDWHARYLTARDRAHELDLDVEPLGSDLDTNASFAAMDADKSLRFFHNTCTDRHKVEQLLDQIVGGIELTGELV